MATSISNSLQARTALHWLAVLLAVLAVAGFTLATELDLFRYRPGGEAHDTWQQRGISVALAAAVLLSWRWSLAGGLVAAMTAVAASVFARNQLVTLDAVLVVVAFAGPALIWLGVAVSRLRLPRAAVAIGVVALACTLSGVAALWAYDDLYGPTHPASAVEALPGSAVVWIWSGGVTGSSAVVTAKADEDVATMRLAVDTAGDFADPVWLDPADVSRQQVARFHVDGLEPATRYHYAVEAAGELDRVRTGTFRTFPDGPASFTIAFGSCSRVGTNGAVFDTIREHEPDLFLILGDFHYANIDGNEPDRFRAVLDHQLTRPGPSTLFRSTPIGYVWDDHDFGGNNADGTSESRPAAMDVYREYVPHYGLAGDRSPVYQSFSIGRARVIVTDTRSTRSPASDPDNADKTMLGEEQKAWLKDELRAANGVYPLIIWVNPVPWIADPAEAGDHWSGYTTERAELANFIADEQIEGLLMLSGDAHMLAIDDGTNSDYSDAGMDGFPVFHAAALDRPGHERGGPYSHGAYPGGGQFGLVTVTDDGGDTITVELSGRTWEDREVVGYAYSIEVPR